MYNNMFLSVVIFLHVSVYSIPNPGSFINFECVCTYVCLLKYLLIMSRNTVEQGASRAYRVVGAGKAGRCRRL
jgi:hypothetical protein